MERDPSSSFASGTVCVTGGTGFFASWLIFKLLEHGYSVNTTVRSSPDGDKDVSYLVNLPGATERLKIFKADLDQPNTFHGAIEGCVGVFHIAHPIDVLGKETEEQITRNAINGMLGILNACLRAKTVKRVVYTSSATTVMFNDSKVLPVETTKTGDFEIDESVWSDLDRLRGFNNLFGIYSITKILSEKVALKFSEEHGLNVVTVIPSWINGPFICPYLPRSVRRTMGMIFGDDEEYENHWSIPMVHTDDLARAHIFLMQNPEAKGRYICSAVDTTIEKLAEFLSARYKPEFQKLPFLDSSMKDKIEGGKGPALSSKKLLDSGFRFSYGLEEIYDDAIKCCKEKGFL